MIKLKSLLEDWQPGEKHGFDNYLTDRTELRDEEAIKQFVEYNALNPIVVDVWKYAKGFNRFPAKITPNGMVYTTGSKKIEFEFKKSSIPNIWLFQTGFDGEKITSNLIKAGKFQFQAFRDMLDE